MAPTKHIVKNRDLLTRRDRDLAEINTLNLKRENWVGSNIAGPLTGHTEKTLKVYRALNPPKGPPFAKGPGKNGAVLYNVGTCLDYNKARVVDPATLTGFALVAYRQRLGSKLDNFNAETGYQDVLDPNEVHVGGDEVVSELPADMVEVTPDPETPAPPLPGVRLDPDPSASNRGDDGDK